MLAWSLVGLEGIAGLIAAGTLVVIAAVLLRRGVIVRIRDERKGGRDDPR